MTKYEFPYYYRYNVSFPEVIKGRGREVVKINSHNPISIGEIVTFNDNTVPYTVVDVKHEFWSIPENIDNPVVQHRTVLIVEELVDVAVLRL